ncbi:hypothetical protein MD484_g7782, partial [Candolleomyces efflorescens]
MGRDARDALMIVDEKHSEDASTLPGPSRERSSGHKIMGCSHRTLDLVYVAFFLVHIPATIILDLQAIYPAWLIPAPVKFLGDLYMTMTNDPVVGSVGGYFGPDVQQQFLWLKCFMWTEALFQLPTFFYGAYNLYHNLNAPKLYPLLVAYGASTAMTTLPCLAVLLTTPSVETAVSEGSKMVVRSLNHSGVWLKPGLTAAQRMLLLGSYVPFFVIPLVIAIDMAIRLRKLSAASWKHRAGKWE